MRRRLVRASAEFDDETRGAPSIVESAMTMSTTPTAASARPDSPFDRQSVAPRLPLRAYGREDDWLLVMQHLAPLLARAYPGGAQWLSRRLDDVEEGRARAQLVEIRGHLSGVAIETPKPCNRIKLSTLWLAPALRGRGLGHELLHACTSRWRADGVPLAWITANSTAVQAVGALVTRHGFDLTACERDRYGAGRDEWVFQWTPEGIASAAGPRAAANC